MGRRSERLSKQGMLASDLAGEGDVIQVVSRAFDVLRCFEGHEARLGNLEISSRCGLPRSTVSRLTHTLTRMGQLADLPRAAVGAQFGSVGERLQQLARGLDPRPIAPRRRPERLTAQRTFDTPLDSVGAIALVLRAASAELCEALAGRGLAPGRATLAVQLEDAPPLRVELAFPEPAREPDWIARLLIGRLEALARTRPLTGEEPRIAGMTLVLDRLADPRGRQLPAFEPQAGKWEELRWSLERLAARFGEGRLWRAEVPRPRALRDEERASLVEIGLP